MAYYQIKNPHVSKFWRVLEWKILAYFMAIWSILWSFGMGIRYIFHVFQCILYKEKPGKSSRPLWPLYGYLVYFSR
jgi:hypothetical protein